MVGVAGRGTEEHTDQGRFRQSTILKRMPARLLAKSTKCISLVDLPFPLDSRSSSARGLFT